MVFKEQITMCPTAENSTAVGTCRERSPPCDEKGTDRAMKRQPNQNRTQALKHPARRPRFKSVSGLLLRAAGNGLLTGLCRLLKGLVITLVLTLGSNTMEKAQHEYCGCIKALKAVKIQDARLRDNKAGSEKDKEVKYDEHDEYNKPGCTK
jgi:hypothetical protein